MSDNINRYISLIDYLPETSRNYKEMKKIMDIETTELQCLGDELDAVSKNQFIQTCDVNGIKKFEKFLGISANDEESLELRRSTVLLRWSESVPYTYKGLLEKLDVICGGNYKSIPKFDKYELDLLVKLELKGQVRELDTFLEKVMPANIKYSVKNELDYDVKGDIFHGGSVVSCEIVSISTENI